MVVFHHGRVGTMDIPLVLVLVEVGVCHTNHNLNHMSADYCCFRSQGNLLERHDCHSRKSHFYRDMMTLPNSLHRPGHSNNVVPKIGLGILPRHTSRLIVSCGLRNMTRAQEPKRCYNCCLVLHLHLDHDDSGCTRGLPEQIRYRICRAFWQDVGRLEAGQSGGG
ncbi:hypothetical protein M407DRAFT_143290 [Tulasnella calospora MUT 4182]|uniref:Uncharacterized protein n=1 Tax=Tulasnella calospora MUT 4182 TaxID=1051891 RepID=A0A0C3Q7C1_9AGAM|nr:hypothetical protein M407DRAFT_143290 [Tulasnella calospora MUT 4182]